MAGYSARGTSRMKQPRLNAALVAWALLASLLLLQHFGGCKGGTTCARDGPHQADPAAVQAATAAAAVVLPPGGGGNGGGNGSGTTSANKPSLSSSLTLEQIEALIRQPPPLFGRQQKGGLPANMYFLLAHMTDTLAVEPQLTKGIPATVGPALYRWFAKAYTYNKTSGESNRDLQSPVPACHYFVDRKHKMLYVRNTKTGGTSICLKLGQKELPMWCKTRPDTCYAKCKDRQLCLEMIHDPEDLKKAFAEYTVFSFIRNPWARALSSWHHINNHGVHPHCQISFAEFAAAPSFYAAKCMATRDCCKFKFGWLLEHLEPQSTCNYDAEGKPVVDFFGRLEHIDEDMQSLFDIVNSKLPEGVEPLRHEKMPRLQLGKYDMRDSEDKLWRYYAEVYKNNTEAMEDIRSYYHMDFDNFRFPEVSAAGS